MFADFRRFLQILKISWKTKHLGNADFRRKPQIFAGNRRKPQKTADWGLSSYLPFWAFLQGPGPTQSQRLRVWKAIAAVRPLPWEPFPQHLECSAYRFSRVFFGEVAEVLERDQLQGTSRAKFAVFRRSSPILQILSPVFLESARSIHHVMWTFLAKIWLKNAKNYHIT